MDKIKAKTEHLRSSAMDKEKREFTLLTVSSLLERLADINPLHESTAEEYTSMRRVLLTILAHEVPDRSDLVANRNRPLRGF